MGHVYSSVCLRPLGVLWRDLERVPGPGSIKIHKMRLKNENRYVFFFVYIYAYI